MRSLPDTDRLVLVTTAIGVAALGIAAERERYAWADTHDWVTDLLVGWTLTGLGLAAFALARPRGAAALLTIAGVTWFVGNFYASGSEWVASTATHLSWVFLAPLVHLALAYPTGRPRTRLAGAGVVAAWLVVVWPWFDLSDDSTRAVALGTFAAVGAFEWLRAPEPSRRDAGRGLVALAALLAWTLAVSRLGTIGSWDLANVVLDAGIVLVGIWLFSGLPSATRLTERAIELDESTGTVRDALARLLGDPALKVGYAIDRAGEFVDDAGYGVPTSIPGTVTTAIEDSTGTVAIVVHNPSVITRDDDRRAVSVAVALAAERARLRDEVRSRADEIAVSTSRLIRTEDDERTRIAARLASGPRARHAEAARMIHDAHSKSASNDEELETALERSAEQLAQAEAELEAFASGLRAPALASGLPAAVAGLVDRLPLTVDARVDDFECPPGVAATIWFVCAEGVANVLKHAEASRLVLEIAETATGIRVTIEDDGVGGVDPTGSGLAGLRDRVAAHGGVLQVISREGEGTRLVADVRVSLAA